MISVVKIEHKNVDTMSSSTTTTINNINNGIPVGIAVARQRLPHELKDVGVAIDDRAAHLAPWPAPQPLWHYPPQVGVDSMVGLGGVPLGGLGTLGPQLMRDPASGALILVPAADPFQQVLWGGYVGAGVLLPPVQLLGTELLSSTTLHHHTQTHSTRLVALAGAPPDPLKRSKPPEEPPACQRPTPPPLLQDASNQTDSPPQSDDEPEERRPIDSSGLELLSNSIEQFETIANANPNPITDVDPIPIPVPVPDPSFDGLGLLCALAEEKRIELLKEAEDGVRTVTPPPRFVPPERRGFYERKRRPDSPSSDDNEEKVNPLELNMIRKLADLQRQYKETQRELSKLTPRKPSEEPIKRGPGRPRKKSSASDTPDNRDLSYDYKSPSSSSNVFSPDRLLAETSLVKSGICIRGLSPVADSNSSQSSVATLGSSKKRKVGRPKKLLPAPGSRVATETIVAKKPKSKSGLVGYLLAKSRLNIPSSNKGGTVYSKNSTSRDESHSKRSGCKNQKSPKIKTSPRPPDPSCYSSPASSLSEYKFPVGYDVNQKYASLLSGETNTVSKMRPKLKAEPKVKEYSEEDDLNDWCGVSQSNLVEAKSHSSSMESLQEVHLKNKIKTDQLAMKHKKPQSIFYPSSESECEHSPKKRKIVINKPNLVVSAIKEPPSATPESKDRCSIPLDDLGDKEMRVLTAMGGLFYAGTLRAVRAPDLYSVTLDGERGNRPHILSREEAIRDAILEVCPTSTNELVPGTRLCAYWSQQYRCLYPGTVAEPSSPDPDNDDKFVAVEFDDGDSGRIALEDIRYLQSDYPIVEYDPNPLLTLGKRRRQTSNSTDDKKHNSSVSSIGSADHSANINASTHVPKMSLDSVISASEHSQLEAEFSHRERKRLKKHKRDKLKRLMSRSGEDEKNVEDLIRKKKKKHKACDERCKHRKHRKHHRKHKRHHHLAPKEQSGSSSEDVSRKAVLNKPTLNRPKLLTVPNSNIDKTKATDVTEVIKDKTQEAIIPSPNSNQIIDGKKPKANTKKVYNVESDNIENSIATLKIKANDRPRKTKTAKSKKNNAEESNISETKNDSTPETPTTPKKTKKRSISSTSEGASASKMAAFLPAGAQLWEWQGLGHRRPQARGKAKKCFYKSLHRGNEIINVGDAAVFLSTGRPDRPYIGQIESLWEGWQGNMAVRVRWYYHPEETTGCPGKLTYPGGLFESPHTDENDVQTISHKCEVITLPAYRRRLAASSDMSDMYYRAGHYNPSLQTLQMEPDIPYSAT